MTTEITTWQDAFAKLSKWRLALSGRIWGTQPQSPIATGRADIFEKLLFLRAEVNAFTEILLEAEVCTREQFEQKLLEHALLLDDQYAQRFPGITTTTEAIVIKAPEALETMKGWAR